MCIRNYLALLLLSFGIAQARQLVIVNSTNQDIRGRVKVQLVGDDKATKKGSVHFDVAPGTSTTCDLATAEKWVRSTTEYDAKETRKGAKIGRRAIATDVGAIKQINLVKIKAKTAKVENESTVKGRVKIQTKDAILHADLAAASHIVITEKDGKLVFTPSLS